MRVALTKIGRRKREKRKNCGHCVSSTQKDLAALTKVRTFASELHKQAFFADIRLTLFIYVTTISNYNNG